MTDDVVTATEVEAHIATLDPSTITINPEPLLSPESDAAATIEASDAPAPVADAAIVAAADDLPQVEPVAEPESIVQEVEAFVSREIASVFEAVHEITHRSFGRASAEDPMHVTTRVGGV